MNRSFSLQARRCFGYVATLGAVVLAGCGGSEPGDAAESVREVPEASSVNEEQRPYFEDGVVTLAEYQEAFAKFEQCASDVGGVVSVSLRDPVTGLITYSSSSALEARDEQSFDESGQLLPSAESPMNDCYQRFFDLTEITFSTNDPTVLAAVPDEQIAMFNQIARPCLVANGVDVPADLEYGTPQYEDLINRWSELNIAGGCDAPTVDATSPP